MLNLITSNKSSKDARERLLNVTATLRSNVKDLEKGVSKEDIAKTAQETLKTASKLVDEVKAATGALSDDNQSGQVTY